MKFEHLFSMNLRLFDGGAAAGASEGAGTTASGTEGSQGVNQATTPGNTRRGKSGDYSNVLFGKQSEGAAASGTVTNAQEQSHAAGGDNNPGVQTTSNTLDERRKAFRELVTGEFKDIYTEETQRMISRRFGEQQALEQKVQGQQAVIDMLMQRYNIGDGDLSKLTAALENDSAYWSEAAEEAGMTVDQYKKFQKLQRENANLQKMQEEQRDRARSQQQAQKWFQEAQEVSKKFKGFNFAKELQNPEFVAMLRAGTPVEHAFKVMHFDELMSGAIQVTAANTEKMVANNVRAKGNRPAENGTNAQSAFTVKDDPSKLTKQDFEEIARRVARGEIISF